MTQRLYARWFYFCLWVCLLLACQPVDEGTPTVTLTTIAAAPTQQWWDLKHLGGEDRDEAADRIRQAIIKRTLPRIT